MKEKNTTSLFSRILVNCSAQAKEYGSCVAAKLPQIERDMCLKEFLALNSCMQKVKGTGAIPLLEREKRLFEVPLLEREKQLFKAESARKMSGQASSSQPVAGSGGSGALSHVYVKFPPLRCDVPESRNLFYDDGCKNLFSVTDNQVHSWKVAPFDSSIASACDFISEGPIFSIRLSLDGKCIAIQRSNNEVQILNRETRETFSQKFAASENILGFFWTDCPLCDIAFVKTSGLELYVHNSESKTLHLVETRKLSVNWYVYTHESRLVLLASGMQCKTFTGFQLSSAGIIRLPKFEMLMAKSEASQKPVLAAADVYIVIVYGRIYCLQVDRVAMLLHSYRFYRDAVVQQGSLPIYSSHVAISVVDNVLLVHQVDAKVVILYDIFLDSRAPISAPLPLLMRGLPRSNSLGSRSGTKDGENSGATYLTPQEATMYGDSWIFLMPDLICDISNGLLWKIHLDLEAIASSSSYVSFVLDFLQRRKLEAYKAKQLCLETARSIILERRPLPLVAKAMDVLISSFSHSFKAGSYFKRTKSEKTQPSIVVHSSSPNSVANSNSIRDHAAGKSSEQGSLSRHEGESFEQLALSDNDSDNKGGVEGGKTTYNNGNGKLLLNAERLRSGSQGLAESPRMTEYFLNTTISQQQEPHLTSPVISPDEMYAFVFAPVEEEMAGDPSYLVAIIVEFLLSASTERIKVHSNIHVLMVQLLARNERFSELGLFVINKILAPSKEVAFQLLESGRQNRETRKLGLDMLRQLSLHQEYVVSMVQDGYLLEALRYAKKHKVTNVRPALFLEVAFASNDTERLATVLRFFSDLTPGFLSSTDHNTYSQLLNEMNAVAAAAAASA